MTERHDSGRLESDPVDGPDRSFAAVRTVTHRIRERRQPMDNILTIIVVVLVVLFIVGYFGRGRFRA